MVENGQIVQAGHYTELLSRIVAPLLLALSCMIGLLLGLRAVSLAWTPSEEPGSAGVGEPYTLTLEAYPTEVMIGECSYLTATVVDEYGQDVPDGTEVTFETDLGFFDDSGVFSVTKTTADGIATAALSSTVAGTAHVTATSDSASDSEVVTFTHGPVNSVDLAPEVETVTPGDSVIYTLTAYDAYSNAWDVTADATFSTPPPAGGSWTDNVYTSEYHGVWTVTGTYDTLSDTATLIVPYP